MGKKAKCCCNCLCPTAFDIAEGQFNWLGNSFDVEFTAGSPGISNCDRAAPGCATDASWILWHDETAVSSWQPRPAQGRNDCFCAGTYTNTVIQVDDQTIRRFKIWYKRRWSAQLIIEQCGGSQARLKVIAAIQYAWLWNSTTKNRNRYTITRVSCPATIRITDPTVEFGDDTGHDPGFPPFDSSFSDFFACEPLEWEESNTCNDGDDITPISITSRFSVCIPETRVFNLGVDTSCNNCASILNPNGGDRSIVSSASFIYLSDCFDCSSIPDEISLSIPGATVDPVFTVYGSAFGSGLCDWLSSFPASPQVTIPRTLSVTLTT